MALRSPVSGDVSRRFLKKILFPTNLRIFRFILSDEFFANRLFGLPSEAGDWRREAAAAIRSRLGEPLRRSVM